MSNRTGHTYFARLRKEYNNQNLAKLNTDTIGWIESKKQQKNGKSAAGNLLPPADVLSKKAETS